MINLFTYGSLMCSDIMFPVADCRLGYTRAILKDFFRSEIINEEYPGITPKAGALVTGILYFNLSLPAIRRLDIFEGELYVRQHIQVATEEYGIIEAMTYVFRQEHSGMLTNTEWRYEKFLTSGKKKFTDAYFGFDEIENSAMQ
jgi:gamma-glutamylcyclotransferase (GGCT)/AIG2-like uncharacterized protein YtfP